MKIRWDYLIKVVIILVFLSPFLYVPVRKIQNWVAEKKFTQPQPVQEVTSSDSGAHHILDITHCANADYHHNAFIPDPASGGSHYPALNAGTYSWRGVPFQIVAPFAETQSDG